MEQWKKEVGDMREVSGSKQCTGVSYFVRNPVKAVKKKFTAKFNANLTKNRRFQNSDQKMTHSNSLLFLWSDQTQTLIQTIERFPSWGGRNMVRQFFLWGYPLPHQNNTVWTKLFGRTISTHCLASTNHSRKKSDMHALIWIVIGHNRIIVPQNLSKSPYFGS